MMNDIVIKPALSAKLNADPVVTKRYGILKYAICDYFDHLTDCGNALNRYRLMDTAKAKVFLRETCSRICESI